MSRSGSVCGRAGLLFFFGLVLILVPLTLLAEQPQPAQRTFDLQISARITELKPGSDVRIWFPVPSSSEDQTIEILSRNFPAESRLTTEGRFGNQMLYCEAVVADSGNLEVALKVRVTRNELQVAKKATSANLSAPERSAWLQADRLVPISGRPQELLLAGVKLPEQPLNRVRALYDIVDQHMKYDKSVAGYGNGDVLWACDSKTGNCTDFHSLFISLARSEKIPAVFEIGFPLPVERGSGNIGGYHCWAKVFVDDRGWLPVDISEADKNPNLKEYYFGNLTENRVAFSRGRDLVLMPPQKSDPLNYFVFPYAEVGANPVSPDNIQLTIVYNDLKP